MRLILLVDMDYFFVACEELRNPKLKGKPTVVGADPKTGRGRGVVSTCNYEARKYGIHSALPISIAYRLKSDAVFLPVDYEYYEKVSAMVMSALRPFADKFEQVSIDEAFMDVSKKAGSYEAALELAKQAKQKLNDELHLPCSIGIGPNKLMAKMASEAAKPNGIKLVKEEEAKKFLEEMPVDKLYGVGRKTTEKLEAMGYKKVGDISHANPMNLMDKFGTYGIDLHKYANGIDESEVQENYEVKSIGRERTFDEDTSNADQIIQKIKEISHEVIEEIRKNGFAFKTVTLKIRYSNFEEHLKSKSLNRLSNDEVAMVDAALELFWKYYDKSELIRKIGVRVSGLAKYKGQKKIVDYA